MQEISTDVLVIGAGGAGLIAAIEAYDRGVKVVLVTKGIFGKGGSTACNLAEIAALNAADGQIDSSDNPDAHFSDVVEAGLGMCDESLARIKVDEAMQAVRDLEKLGVEYEKNENGTYVEFPACFSSRPRSHIIQGGGRGLVACLKNHIKDRNIPVYEKMTISNLLVQDNVCIGAVGIDEKGDSLVFWAKSTVLAAGGGGQLFACNLNPPDITGDGYAIAYRAGAELFNMEFMQAGLGIIFPIRNVFSGWVWFLHPEMYNGRSERFLGRYLPEGISSSECIDAKATHFPFSSRDASKYIEIAVLNELKAGRGTEHNGIYLDFTKVDENTLDRIPWADQVKKAWELTKQWFFVRGIDVTKQPLEVGCFAHALNGGIVINTKAESTISALYAAGEVAGGPHGADRLGGDMLLACQVFGTIAGRQSADNAKERKVIVDKEAAYVEKQHLENLWKGKKGGLQVRDIRNRLQELAWRNLLIVRNKRNLKRCLEEISRIKEDILPGVKIKDKKQLKHLIELQNMLQVGEIITHSAMLREESRGSHYREDFPTEKPEWNLSLVVKMEKGKMNYCKRKLPTHSYLMRSEMNLS